MWGVKRTPTDAYFAANPSESPGGDWGHVGVAALGHGGVHAFGQNPLAGIEVMWGYCAALAHSAPRSMSESPGGD